MTNTLSYYNAAKMEQCTFKNANNCLDSNIYSYLKTSGGQSFNLFFFIFFYFLFSSPVLIRHLWQLKTVFLPVSNMRCSVTLVVLP